MKTIKQIARTVAVSNALHRMTTRKKVVKAFGIWTLYTVEEGDPPWRNLLGSGEE